MQGAAPAHHTRLIQIRPITWLRDAFATFHFEKSRSAVLPVSLPMAAQSTQLNLRKSSNLNAHAKSSCMQKKTEHKGEGKKLHLNAKIAL